MEKKILQLISSGKKRKCVADELYISERTLSNHLQHIFEKFYQGDSSRKSLGNGLGLALVKRIVELSQGVVEVDSAPGAGSTFRVILPK